MPLPSRADRFGDHYPADDAWLALAEPEAAIDPDLPIVDAHHHLWARPGRGGRPGIRYMADDYAADLNSGHNIKATVYVECHMGYRPSGPDLMRPLGEVEYANGVAALAESGLYGHTRINAGIVAHADLSYGEAITPLIEAMLQTAGPRLSGIRHNAHWDAEPAVRGGKGVPGPGLYEATMVRKGVETLAKFDLAFDAWVYHPQLADVTALARAVPAARIVMNHMGGPLGMGSYAHRPDEVFSVWRSGVLELATCSNVVMKIGGASNRLINFLLLDRPPTSEQLATAWRPYVETCFEAFGPERCMFEASFPPDRNTASYAVHWNAFKRLASGLSGAEKTAAFSQVAAQTYRLAI